MLTEKEIDNQKLDVSLYASELSDRLRNNETIHPDMAMEILSKIYNCIQLDNSEACPDSKLTMIDSYIKELKIGL